jgi:IS4 transposase
MGRISAGVVEAVSRVFEGVELGDGRLENRLERMVSLIAASPGESFPTQMEGVADREALYRFLSNPKVTMDRLLSGHLTQSLDRARHYTEIRVIHDTTSLLYSGDRVGLGIIARGQRGFRAHVALAVTADEVREPLGVFGVRPFIHQHTLINRKLSSGQITVRNRKKPRHEKESGRWEKLAMEVSATLPVGTAAIHIMDQEADDYALFSELETAGLRYVVRVYPERMTAMDNLPVRAALATAPAKLFRNVWFQQRTAKQAKQSNKPVRSERVAKLRIRWGVVTLRRHRGTIAKTNELSITAVHVYEPKPPRGQEPIQWMLFTSDQVETFEDAAAIVDHYRARWVIEEYFKALKTGCAIEKRQLTTYEGLSRALGLFVPMAWHLLALRHLGRAPKPHPAKKILNHEQLLLLAALLKERRYSFPMQPTVCDAMLGIAALGGHIKNNGDPGWLVLGRGFTRFAEAESVWRLARTICDQS